MLKSIYSGQRILIFRLCGHLCAIRTECVCEIVPMAQLSCPPGMPTLLQGLLNLAGKMIPVLRLDRLFGLQEHKPDLYTPLLVVRIKETRAALLVDNVLEVAAIPSLVPVVDVQHSFNSCAEAAIHIGGETVHLLSVDQILLQQERKCVMEFAAIEQQRLSTLERVTS
jgi:purine-binding chemotaxis protein CheW